jgi:hypothetical protein
VARKKPLRKDGAEEREDCSHLSQERGTEGDSGCQVHTDSLEDPAEAEKAKETN